MVDIFGATALLGKHIDDKNNEIINKKKYKNDIKLKKKNGIDIYSSQEKRKNDKLISELARKKDIQSREPLKTGVIPKYYNSINKSNKKITQTDMDTDANIETFHNQFNELRYDNKSCPSASNLAHSIPNMSRLEMERNIALNNGFSNFNDENMTYDVINNENFIHNNMIPFIRGKTTGYDDNFIQNQQNEYKNRTLELFTGKDKRPDYQHKSEQKPLFNPQIGLTNAYGHQNMTGYFQERYIPSKEKRNDLPFTQEKITPGVGLGYNQVSSGGFNDSYRPPIKSVDELRTVSNPKTTYKPQIIPGMKEATGPNIPNKIERKGAESFAILCHPTNKYKANAPSAPTNYVIEPTKRDESSTFYSGGANANGQSNANMAINYKPVIKQSLEEEHDRNIQLGNKAGVSNYDIKKTLRQLMENNIYTGAIGNNDMSSSYVYNPNDWTPNITLKDMLLHQNQMGQIQSSDKGYIPFNTPNITIKDLNILNKFEGNVQGYQQGISFNPNDKPNITTRSIKNSIDFLNAIYQNSGNILIPTDTPDITMRDIQNYEHMGIISGNSNGYAFDPNNKPDITKRDIQNYEQTGNISGNPNGYAFDPNNKPDITKRDIQNYEHMGIISGNANGYAFDPNNKPDITIRDIQNYEHMGTISGNANGYAFDPNNKPDITMRDIQNYEHMGTISGNANGYAFDPNNKPDITMRDIQNYEQTGNVSGNPNGYAFDPNNKPNITIRDIQNYEYNGNISGNANGYAFDPDNKPNITMRDIQNYEQTGNVSGNPNGYVFDPNDKPDITKRNLQNSEHSGNISGNVNGYVYDSCDIPNITRRNLQNSEQTGNISGNKNGYVLDPADTAQQTLRELFGNTDFSGNITGNNANYVMDENYTVNPTLRGLFSDEFIGNITGNQMGYSFDKKNIPDHTMRELMAALDIGNIKGNVNNGYILGKENKANMTLREVINKIDHSSNVKLNGSQYVNNWDIPNNTKRNLTENTTLIGNILEKTMGYTRNENDILDPTKRNLTELQQILNGLYNPKASYAFDEKNAIPDQLQRNLYNVEQGGNIFENNANYIYDEKNYKPDPTKRDIYKSEQVGGLLYNNSSISYVYDVAGATPDHTLRDIYQDNKYINPIKTSYDDSRSRADYNNAILNVINENISSGRSPTNSNYNEGPLHLITNENIDITDENGPMLQLRNSPEWNLNTRPLVPGLIISDNINPYMLGINSKDMELKKQFPLDYDLKNII